MAYFNILKIPYRQFKLLFSASKDNSHCPKFLKSNFLLYCVICMIVLKIIMVGFYINFPPNIFFADITKIDLNNLINQSRKEAGVMPLRENEKLNKVAELRAKDMLEKEYFSHQNPEGKSPWDWFLEAGYNYKYAGENLAIGFSNSEQVYYAWINSPSHKENILNPNYKEMGTAILRGFGKNKAVIVVQVFGSFLTDSNINVGQTINTYGPEEEFTENEFSAAPNETKSTVDIKTNEERESFFQADKNNKFSLYYAFLNFIVYDYEIIFRNISYGLLATITLVLFFWMFYGYNSQYRNVVLRSVLFIVLLFAALSFNKGMISVLFSYQIII